MQQSSKIASFFIPEELLIEILARLPVKSLLKFKTVCKKWYNLFNDPDFIAKNYEIRAKNNNLLVWGCVSVTPFIFYDEYPNEIKCVEVNLPEKNAIFGCVRGVFCYSNSLYFDEFFLWNPATRQRMQLPSPKSLEKSLHICTWYYYHASGVGFGLDHRANEHKIVKMWSFRCLPIAGDDPGLASHYPTRLLVYTPSANYWRAIDAVPPGNFRGRCCCFIGGKCYWMDFDLPNRELVLFDMADEVFQITQLPEPPADDKPVSWQDVMIMNDSIAFASVYSDDSFTIWLMNDCDGVVSWSMYHSMSCFHAGKLNRYCPAWKNCEFLVLDGENLLSYDPFTHEIRNVAAGLKKFHREFVYNESLISF